MIRGQAWGNLYLTEKQGEEPFNERDEEAAMILADWAAIAIDNARVYETSERRREELEKAFRSLEATRDVAVAIGGEIALEHVLELIVKRGRALVGGPQPRDHAARRAGAGRARERRSRRARCTACACRSPTRPPARCSSIGGPSGSPTSPRELRIAPSEFGVLDAQTALLVPMLYRGEALGVLAAFDRGEDGGVFGEDDEQMLRTFAASAATAVAMAQSVQADRLRSSLAAADAERRRWARELHDETLQGLGGLRVLLSSALRRNDPERAQEAMREAVEHIEQEIGNLRAIITELRPAALDELGLRDRDRGAARSPPRAERASRSTSELVLPGPSAREGRLDGGSRDRRLPAGPGGAHERRQARARGPGARRVPSASRAGAVDRGARTTARASIPRR